MLAFMLIFLSAWNDGLVSYANEKVKGSEKADTIQKSKKEKSKKNREKTEILIKFKDPSNVTTSLVEMDKVDTETEFVDTELSQGQFNMDDSLYEDIMAEKMKSWKSREEILEEVKSEMKLNKFEIKELRKSLHDESKMLKTAHGEGYQVELIELDSTDDIDEVIQFLETYEGVEYVQPNYKLQLFDETENLVNLQIDSDEATESTTQTMTKSLTIEDEIEEVIETTTSTMNEQILTDENTVVETTTATFTLQIPEDRYFNDQWGHRNTGQVVRSQEGMEGMDSKILEAWSITKGNDSVLVGVLDSGIDIGHEDLSENIYVNEDEIAGNGIDDDLNGYVDDLNGWDFFNSDCTVYDDSSDAIHGTHIAGIIAAKENGIGIVGVAPEVKLLPLKFLSDNVGYTSDAIEAIEYAESMGVSIMNCSFGSTEYNSALREAMKNSNMLFVCAAGNNGYDSPETPVYPASFKLKNVVSVAAHDNAGAISVFSSYGETVDFAAPGQQIISTVPEDGYDYKSGTSMATAYATGVAALVKSQFPELIHINIGNRLKENAKEVEAMLEKVASNGILDAYLALTREATMDDGTTVEEEPGLDGLDEDLLLEGLSSIPEDLLLEIYNFRENLDENTITYNGNFNIGTMKFGSYELPIEMKCNTYKYEKFRLNFDITRKRVRGDNDYYYHSFGLPNGDVHVFKQSSKTFYKPINHFSQLTYESHNYTLRTEEQIKYTYAYPSYHLSKIEYPDGNTINVYNEISDNERIRIVDPLGRVYRFDYSERKRYLEKATDPYGKTATFTYNSTGDHRRLLSMTNFEGITRKFEYESLTKAAGTYTFLTKVKDGNNNVLEEIHHKLQTSSSFNDFIVNNYTNANGRKITITKGSSSRYRWINDQLGSNYFKDFYSTVGKPHKIVDPYSNETIINYFRGKDVKNRVNLSYVTSETDVYLENNITDKAGNFYQFEWGQNGNMSHIINPDGSIRYFYYDDKNNPTKEIDEEGKKTFYVYDSSKVHLIKKVQPLNGTAEFVNGMNESAFAVTTYDYYTKAEATSQFGCSLAGLLKKETDPEGRTKTYTYDSYGFIRTVKDSLGYTETAVHNKYGNVTRTVSATGLNTYYTYDTHGNLVKERRVNTTGDEITRYLYDNENRLIQKITPNQYNASMDGLNNSPVSQSYGDSNAGYRYTYYKSGLVKTETDPLNNKISYVYDIYILLK